MTDPIQDAAAAWQPTTDAVEALRRNWQASFRMLKQAEADHAEAYLAYTKGISDAQKEMMSNVQAVAGLITPEEP